MSSTTSEAALKFSSSESRPALEWPSTFSSALSLLSVKSNIGYFSQRTAEFIVLSNAVGLHFEKKRQKKALRKFLDGLHSEQREEKSLSHL